MSCSVFSQNLTPFKHTIKDDSVFCFSWEQSRHLAQWIVEAKYCDSIRVKQEEEKEKLLALLNSQEQLVIRLKLKTENHALLMEQQRTTLYTFEETFNQQHNKIKKLKFQKSLMLLGVIALGVISAW